VPRIPIYQRQLGPQSPQFQPAPMRVQPGAAGEDIWKAAAQAGKDLQQVSGDLFKIAKEEKQRNDIYETKKVYADASKQLNEAMYGENGYLTLSGQNADGVYEKAQQRIEEIGKAARERLQNDDQQWRFDQVWSGDAVQGLKQVLAHQTEQRRVGEIDTTTALLGTAVNNFVASAGDDEAMTKAMDKVRDNILSLAKLNGWSQEQAQAKFDEQHSLALQGVINQYLSRGDPMKAKEIFDEHGVVIAPKDRPAMAGKIKSEVEAFELERDVNTSMAQLSAMPYAERLKFVEQLPVKTEQQRKVRGLVSRQVNALEENRKRQEAESSFKAAESVYNRITAARSDSSKTMPTVMEIERLDLPAHLKNSLMNEVDARTAPLKAAEERRRQFFGEETFRLEAANRPEQFGSREDVLAWANKAQLSVETTRKLLSSWETLNKVPDLGKAYQVLKQEVAPFTGKDKDDISAMNDALFKWSARYEAEHGRAPGYDEILKYGRFMAKDIVVKGAFFDKDAPYEQIRDKNYVDLGDGRTMDPYGRVFRRGEDGLTRRIDDQGREWLTAPDGTFYPDTETHRQRLQYGVTSDELDRAAGSTRPGSATGKPDANTPKEGEDVIGRESKEGMKITEKEGNTR